MEAAGATLEYCDEVVSEAALPDLAREIAVGGRDDAHPWTGGPGSPELAGFAGRQEPAVPVGGLG